MSAILCFFYCRTLKYSLLTKSFIFAFGIFDASNFGSSYSGSNDFSSSSIESLSCSVVFIASSSTILSYICLYFSFVSPHTFSNLALRSYSSFFCLSYSSSCFLSASLISCCLFCYSSWIIFCLIASFWRCSSYILWFNSAFCFSSSSIYLSFSISAGVLPLFCCN